MGFLVPQLAIRWFLARFLGFGSGRVHQDGGHQPVVQHPGADLCGPHGESPATRRFFTGFELEHPMEPGWKIDVLWCFMENLGEQAWFVLAFFFGNQWNWSPVSDGRKLWRTKSHVTFAFLCRRSVLRAFSEGNLWHLRVPSEVPFPRGKEGWRTAFCHQRTVIFMALGIFFLDHKIWSGPCCLCYCYLLSPKYPEIEERLPIIFFTSTVSVGSSTYNFFFFHIFSHWDQACFAFNGCLEQSAWYFLPTNWWSAGGKWQVGSSNDYEGISW